MIEIGQENGRRNQSEVHRRMRSRFKKVGRRTVCPSNNEDPANTFIHVRNNSGASMVARRWRELVIRANLSFMTKVKHNFSFSLPNYGTAGEVWGARASPLERTTKERIVFRAHIVSVACFWFAFTSLVLRCVHMASGKSEANDIRPFHMIDK